MPKRRPPSGAKVKRLTLYPQKFIKPEKPEAPEVSEAPEAKPKGEWRWVPTREKPEMKAPERLPYYKESPPRYEAPAEPPSAPRPETPPWAKNFLIVVGVVVIPLALILGVLIIEEIDWGPDGGGGGSLNCPTTCNSTVGVTVDQRCSCPSPCLRSFKSTNPPGVKGNFKQCYR